MSNRLLDKYEDKLADAPGGKKYQQCYDLKTQKPSTEYMRLYDNIPGELDRMGVTMQLPITAKMNRVWCLVFGYWRLVLGVIFLSPAIQMNP